VGRPSPGFRIHQLHNETSFCSGAIFTGGGEGPMDVFIVGTFPMDVLTRGEAAVGKAIPHVLPLPHGEAIPLPMGTHRAALGSLPHGCPSPRAPSPWVTIPHVLPTGAGKTTPPPECSPSPYRLPGDVPPGMGLVCSPSPWGTHPWGGSPLTVTLEWGALDGLTGDRGTWTCSPLTVGGEGGVGRLTRHP